MGRQPVRVFLAELVTDPVEKELVDQRMEELQQLVDTYGGLTIVETVQQRMKPDYQYYLGRGKLTELREQMKAEDVDILIIGNILKPAQIYNVNEYMRQSGLQARDRVDLILKIFERHASSTEAKLQIELAAIKHMGPRIFGMGMELSRQAGGIGTSGIGETNIEIMRRHLDKRKKSIEKKLQKYERVRATHRQSRKRNRLPTVGLVGYTNAGKSSLMNRLTGKGVLVEDKLFATLGTDVGQLYIPSMSGKGTTILINDTIGFIRDLPPELIQAFTSTLEDSVESDLLLHMIDSTDPLLTDKISVVDQILDSIGAEQTRWYVFNKIDQLSVDQLNDLQRQYSSYDGYWVSAHTGAGIEPLTDQLATHL